jgi:hypothetical protein
MTRKQKAAIERARKEPASFAKIPREKRKPAHAPAPAAVVDDDDADFENDTTGTENITISARAFWLDDSTVRWWAEAIEAIDKRGDKEPLKSYLRSELELLPEARLFLADMIDRYQLKPKRGRKATPAYDRTGVEAMLEIAIKDVSAHRGEIDVALKEVAQRYSIYGITEKTLKNAFEERRGSTRRMKARRGEETRKVRRRTV